MGARLSLQEAVCKGAPVDTITRKITPHNINMHDKYGDTALHKALSWKRWELVPILIQHGADVNLCCRWNQTPLHSAALYDAPADIITQLISPHNINMHDEDGDTVLSEAVRGKRWDLVKVLLQHRADVNSSGYIDKTPFAFRIVDFTARHSAPANIITQLLSPHNINVQDEDGDTVLHKTVRWKIWDLVPVLLQQGADLNMVNRWNQTPLYNAAWYGAPEDIVTQLISPHNINMQDEVGDTALHWAVRKKNWYLVPVLLQHGADVDVRNCSQQTPLHCAAWYSAPADIITQLISPHNINMQDKGGSTALHVAVEKRPWDLVPVLLQHGADVDVRNCSQQTPLHCAAWYSAPADIITQLISPHNINMQDKDGETVLHTAVWRKNWELVPVLLQHGADVNLSDCLYRIPLHRAACHSAQADIITQLISPHNINVQDKDGNTALHEAVRRERWELVPVLLQYGADPSMLDCPAQPLVLSLKAVCIATIRSQMPVKSDSAYEGLGLPGKLVSEVKLRPQAEDIVNRGCRK